MLTSGAGDCFCCGSLIDGHVCCAGSTDSRTIFILPTGELIQQDINICSYPACLGSFFKCPLAIVSSSFYQADYSGREKKSKNVMGNQGYYYGSFKIRNDSHCYLNPWCRCHMEFKSVGWMRIEITLPMSDDWVTIFLLGIVRHRSCDTKRENRRKLQAMQVFSAATTNTSNCCFFYKIHHLISLELFVYLLKFRIPQSFRSFF